MELNILELSPSHAFGLKGINKPEDFLSVIDQYELHTTDLSKYNVLLVTDFVDQEYLYKQKNLIENFLNEGKVVLFCGHLFREWLPGCSFFMPKKINSFKDYLVKTIPGSPLFEGLEVEDMIHNKGVAGFFARGFYYPPENSEVCLTFTDGKVITYIDRNTTKGSIIVHAGRNLLAYKDSKIARKKIGEQTIALLRKEIAGGKN